MIKSYKKFWQNILNFSGTANRSEYWWPVIINWILAFVLMNLVESLLGHSIGAIGALRLALSSYPLLSGLQCYLCAFAVYMTVIILLGGF